MRKLSSPGWSVFSLKNDRASRFCVSSTRKAKDSCKVRRPCSRAWTIRIVQALEHGLRTLHESFAFRVELTQNLEARSFFSENTLQPGELSFRIREQVLLLL